MRCRAYGQRARWSRSLRWPTGCQGEMFDLFREQEDRQDQFRFGREADGSPAKPADWRDLD
jgi:hypothetical protein